jgi:shikimate dehydrogenase
LLLANCSSLGMAGQPPLQMDLSPLPQNAVVYDIVYAPLETDLLKSARDFGLDRIDGLTMLIGQAALAFELFFGVAPPQDEEDELRMLLIS